MGRRQHVAALARENVTRIAWRSAALVTPPSRIGSRGVGSHATRPQSVGSRSDLDRSGPRRTLEQVGAASARSTSTCGRRGELAALDRRVERDRERTADRSRRRTRVVDRHEWLVLARRRTGCRSRGSRRSRGGGACRHAWIVGDDRRRGRVEARRLTRCPGSTRRREHRTPADVGGPRAGMRPAAPDRGAARPIAVDSSAPPPRGRRRARRPRLRRRAERRLSRRSGSSCGPGG